jgi:hypothetical protein
MLSTDEGYQCSLEAFVGNFTANIAASKLAESEWAFCIGTVRVDRSNA